MRNTKWRWKNHRMWKRKKDAGSETGYKIKIRPAPVRLAARATLPPKLGSSFRTPGSKREDGGSGNGQERPPNEPISPHSFIHIASITRSKMTFVAQPFSLSIWMWLGYGAPMCEMLAGRRTDRIWMEICLFVWKCTEKHRHSAHRTGACSYNPLVQQSPSFSVPVAHLKHGEFPT